MAAVAWWWAIPGVALVLAVSWAAWTSRALRTPSMRDSMSDFAEWSAVLDRLHAATPVGHEPTAGAAGVGGAADVPKVPDTPDASLPEPGRDNP